MSDAKIRFVSGQVALELEIVGRDNYEVSAFQTDGLELYTRLDRWDVRRLRLAQFYDQMDTLFSEAERVRLSLHS